ncbi:MAG: permease [Elusimicrobia bacterium]|nr:permease [Candidatus Liberimonas magnetica]
MAIDPICGMAVDESTNLKIGHKGQVYYFCSQRCLQKFAAQNAIQYKSDKGASCPVCEEKAFKWYRNKVFIVSSVLLIITALSFFIEFLEPFRFSLFMYIRMIGAAVLIGLAIGGVIDYYIPREYISKILSKPQKRTIFMSVFLGFLMTACSHGILALAIQLYKKGASTPAVVSFLLASPWANMTLTIMLVAFFGAKGFYIIISAIIIAVITGFIFQFLEEKGLVETNPNAVSVDESFSILADIKKRYENYSLSAENLSKDLKGVFEGTLSLSNMVLWWILIGIGIASVTAAYVPHSVFHQYMGPTFTGLLITLALATIIEVCSEGSAPLAFEIYRQTGSLGNSFVFLMAGVVTDYTEIGLLWSNIGRKTAVWLPIVAVPQVLVLGILANYLFK